jgi:hypothetical protein
MGTLTYTWVVGHSQNTLILVVGDNGYFMVLELLCFGHSCFVVTEKLAIKTNLSSQSYGVKWDTLSSFWGHLGSLGLNMGTF